VGQFPITAFIRHWPIVGALSELQLHRKLGRLKRALYVIAAFSIVMMALAPISLAQSVAGIQVGDPSHAIRKLNLKPSISLSSRHI